MAGGASFDDDDDETITAINVTPLVDIMLVLLIVFMVASTYIVENSIEVNLPKAASGGETLATTLNLIVQADGALFLNGEPTTLEGIAARCKAVAAQTKDAQAVIMADKDVKHGAVIKLIDLVRVNGVEKFALSIDPDAE